MNLRRIYAQALISRLNKITPQPEIIKLLLTRPLGWVGLSLL